MSLPLLYRKSPVFIQNALISLRGYLIQKSRFNNNFNSFLNYFENSNPDNVNIIRFREFIYKANETEFWKDRFVKYGVDIYADDIISEIKKMPIITKTEIKDNITKIINPNISKSEILKVMSSGTTGSGLVFFQTKIMENVQWAIWWRYRRRFGLDINNWCGWFGGRSIIDVESKKPPYWRINYPGKQILFSAHHLKAETVKYYYDKIKNSKIEWLHGYPSQLAFLSSLIIENKLPPLSLKYITTGAENLLEHQKELIAKALGAMPINHYGLSEGVANISQLPTGQLQVDYDFALSEFVPIDLNSDTFRLIGTNYYNDAFPLIRYDTNDLVKVIFLDGKPKVLSIDGRNEDYVVLKSGIKLGRLDHIFKDLVFVREAQIYQPDFDNLIIKIVKGSDYNENIHENIIIQNFKERLGNDIYLKIEYYTEIPKTLSGKLKFVISGVK